MPQSLAELVEECLLAEELLMDLESSIAGLEISVIDLKGQSVRTAKDEKASEEERKASQQAYTDEARKLKERRRDAARQEQIVLQLRQAKRAAKMDVKREQEDPAYEVLTPKSTPQMQGSVVASIPDYSGALGLACEGWVKQIDRTKAQYDWTSKATAQMVRNKLTGSAGLFIDNQEKEFIKGIDTWDAEVQNGQNLRTMLLEKFSITTSASAATQAVGELKQDAMESVDSFYERVRFGVDKLLYNFPKNEEHLDDYQQLFRSQVWIFFKAGLQQSITEKIFNTAADKWPNTSTELLQAARTVEREKAGTGRRVFSPRALNQIDVRENEDEAAAQAEPRQQQEIFRGRFGRGGRGRGQGRGRGRGRGRGGGHGNANPPRFQPNNQWNQQQQQQNPIRFQGFRGINRGNRGAVPRQQQQQQRRDGGYCFNCGAQGHWADRCPEPRRPQQQQRANPIQQQPQQHQQEDPYPQYPELTYEDEGVDLNEEEN